MGAGREGQVVKPCSQVVTAGEDAMGLEPALGMPNPELFPTSPASMHP